MMIDAVKRDQALNSASKNCSKLTEVHRENISHQSALHEKRTAVMKRVISASSERTDLDEPWLWPEV